MVVDSLYDLVSQPPWEVQVYVGEYVSVLGDEPLQSKVPLQGIDVADADEVADQQGHGRSSASDGRTLFQRSLWRYQSLFFCNVLSYETYLAIQKQEARQVELAKKPELFFEPIFDCL